MDSRAESESSSLASQIHDCARELMEATNVIEARAKESVDKIKSVSDANCTKVDAAKKSSDDKKKKEVAIAVSKVKDEGAGLEVRCGEVR